MVDVVLKSGQRNEHQQVEIDFDGNSVYGIDDFTETKRYPFFHIGKVVYDDGVVFLEHDRE